MLENGEMLTPLATELENIEELLDGETSRGPTLLALSAFGEDVRAWTDERAYYASPDPREPDLASRSFVPAGLFGEHLEDMEATALITGTVASAAVLRNAFTGASFVHARVATYAMTVDCLFVPDDLPAGLGPGNVVQGTFWLMGRLLPAA